MGSKIVLIGAGSAQFGFGTLADIFGSQTLAGSEIVLHDINPQALDHVYQAAHAHVREKALPFTLSAAISRQEALQDADFCIISIEVGNRFALWEQDRLIPLQYGIRQVFGENGGPGGLFHSLRIIPPILEICQDIQAICPQAFVFNFSNPMSRICYTVHREYPDLRFVGLCHEIASLPEHLPRILNTPFENLDIQAGGLNHFSVLLRVSYRDSRQDAYPELRAKAPAYFESLPDWRTVSEGMHKAGGELDAAHPHHAQSAARTWAERGLFKEILARFGYLPITTDSHFGEYIPWAADVVDHKGILDFYYAYKHMVTTREPKMGDPTPSERIVPIIEGILTHSGQDEMAVNLPNDGLIDNLPAEMIVEVPGTIDRGGVHGTPLGELPRAFAGLLLNQVAVHDLTAEAVLTGSKAVVLQALLVDPVVHSLRSAEQTLDTILDLQHPYLDYIR